MSIIKKIRSKRGNASTILAYVVVFLPLLYLILLSFAWQIRDNTQDYIHATLRTAVDVTTKRGVFDKETKDFIINKIGDSNGNGLYLPNEYEIMIGKQDEGNLGGGNATIIKTNINNINLTNKLSFKVGDIVYIQFKIIQPSKEPMSSRLIKLLSRDDSVEYDNLLMVQQGMVEVNGQ